MASYLLRGVLDVEDGEDFQDVAAAALEVFGVAATATGTCKRAGLMATPPAFMAPRAISGGAAVCERAGEIREVCDG